MSTLSAKCCIRQVASTFYQQTRFLSGLKPRRSLLYVPGDSAKKIAKASKLSSDVVILDCEDGVAFNKKTACRDAIQESLCNVQFLQEVGVRVNSIDSLFCEEDITSVLRSPWLPNSLMIPKIESADQLRWLKDKSANFLTTNDAFTTGKRLKVIGQIETPQGMFNIKDILQEASEKNMFLRFEAFVFGSDDYLASIGAVRTRDALELLFARQFFVMHVKGFGMQAIDMVDINFKDLDGLKDQSEQGARMGFTGKQIIHPNQINIVNNCFSPTEHQIAYAMELVDAFNEHQNSGEGAFTFRGAMIDMPSVKQARNVLTIAEKIAQSK